MNLEEFVWQMDIGTLRAIRNYRRNSSLIIVSYLVVIQFKIGQIASQ